MATLEPRLRLLLRQADKAADAGKRPAARELYQQILDESPNADAAWAGLAAVSATEAEQREAYERALALNPQNEAAQHGLALLNGEIVEEVETAVIPETIKENLNIVDEESDALAACYRHPNRETGLRCYNCSRPICSDCTNKTPVGYLCPECIREKEDIFFNNKTRDYFVAALVTFPLSLIAGFVLTLLGGGFFLIFIAFWIGGAIGAGIGRLAKRAVGNRRGRYLPHTVAAMVILGVLLPSLSTLLLGGGLGRLLVPGIFLFVATSAAFYAAR